MVPSPQPIPLVKKLLFLGYILAILLVFGAMVLPGFFITKVMIKEDPITLKDIWIDYKFEFLVVRNID